MKICPVCETNKYRKKLLKVEGGVVYKCEGCGLGIFKGPMPTYVGADIKESNLVRFFKRILLWHEFGYLQQKKKLLEIGSGSGELAAYLDSRGHKVYCSDIDKNNLKRIKETFGFKTIYWDVSKPKKMKDKFDCIVLRHVFEHFDDPVSVLKNLKALLKPGGSLIFTQPNFGSWSRILAKEKWVWTTPYHRFFWDLKTLQALLEKEGFVVTRKRGIFSPFGFPLHLGKILGFKQNSVPVLLFTAPLGIILEFFAVFFNGSNNLLLEAKSS